MRQIVSVARRREIFFNNHACKVAAAVTVSGLLLHAGIASAASTWTGGNTTVAPASGNWNSPGNWSPGGIPVAGLTTELDFLGGATSYVSTDDISGAFALNSLQINSTAGTIAALAGDSLAVSGTAPVVQQSAAGLFTIAAPVAINSNTGISVVNGGEIDFTGNVTNGGSSAISLNNSSGTGNATVKFTGANTFSSLTINPNVTAATGTSGSTTTLGAGAVTLNGGKLALQGQHGNGAILPTALGVTGFNADLIADAAAVGTVGHPLTVSSTGTQLSTIDSAAGPQTGNLLFVNGYNSNTGGLPGTGLVTSTTTNGSGLHTLFRMAYNGSATDYTSNNALYFRNTTPQTLTLTTPSQVSALQFLAQSASAGESFSVQLNFTSGAPSTYASAITTGPWALGTAPANTAVTGTNAVAYGSTGGVAVNFNWRLTENDINLSPADAARTISSIQFTPTTADGNLNPSSEIYAIDGTEPSFGLQLAQTYANSVNVTADSSIDVTNSLSATMGSLSIGGNTLSATSADTTGASYSLALGAVTLTGNPTFDAKNSAGGGAGSLLLGALNDGGVARAITIKNDTGTVTLNAPSPNLTNPSTTISVPTGATLNINALSAWGAGTININGGNVTGNASSGSTGGTGLININSGTLTASATDGLGSQVQVNMTGGTFVVNAVQRISTLTDTGTAGTILLTTNALIVGSTDNLSSTFNGVIQQINASLASSSARSSSLKGAFDHYGTGTLTLTGATNNQLATGIIQGTIIVAGPSTVTNGVIAGPVGSDFVLVGPGGGNANASLLLDNTPGRSLPNTVYIGSGGSVGAPGTGQTTIGALNTSGTTTYSGDVVLGSSNSGFFGVTGLAILGASNGGEVDFTGNIVSNHDETINAQSNPLTIRNLSGTGNATVKVLGQNNNYRLGTEIDPNVTLVVPPSPNTHLLGSGTVTLAGGVLVLQGQQAHGTQQANIVTNAGFNQKIIVPSNGGTYSAATNALASTTSTVDGTSVLYASGYKNAAGTASPFGVDNPVSTQYGGTSGLYTSEYNPDVKFQLQPYTSNTALQFKNGVNSTGTLTLGTPAAYKTINILSMNNATAAVTFNFADGTTETQTLVMQPWIYGNTGQIGNDGVAGTPAVSLYQRLAIGGVSTNAAQEPAFEIGSINRATDAFSTSNASMYEDDFTLAPADQSKILNSISFAVTDYQANATTANILAVSGATYVPPVLLTTQTLLNNVAVSTPGTVGNIDVNGSLNTIMGNHLAFGSTKTGTDYVASPGAYTLNVTSSDTSGSPYSLTLATLPDTLDAFGTAPEVSLNSTSVTFNVANSAGGGAGTLVLGPFDDFLQPGSSQTINKTGAGVLTLSAAAISFAPDNTYTAAVNVTGGTLNINNPTALGVRADVSVSTAAINVGPNSGTSGPYAVTFRSLTVGTGGTFTVQNAVSPAMNNRTVVVTGSLSNTGKIDLNSNDMIVQNTTASSLFSQIQSGFGAHGAWNGSTGIISTAAANDTRHLTTLGYRQSPGGTVDGVSTTTADALVKYTYFGDANLDGVVDGADYQQIDSGFGSHLTGWSNGDFNYDGVVDGSDFSLIDNTFNQTRALGLTTPLAMVAGNADLTASPSDLTSSAVPEPTSLGLLGIGAMGLMGRRRRRQV